MASLAMGWGKTPSSPELDHARLSLFDLKSLDVVADGLGFQISPRRFGAEQMRSFGSSVPEVRASSSEAGSKNTRLDGPRPNLRSALNLRGEKQTDRISDADYAQHGRQWAFSNT